MGSRQNSEVIHVPMEVEYQPAWLTWVASTTTCLRALDIECDPVDVAGFITAAQQEIDMLALAKGAGPLSANDVLLAVADSARFDSFQLVEHMLAGHAPDALRVAALAPQGHGASVPRQLLPVDPVHPRLAGGAEAGRCLDRPDDRRHHREALMHPSIPIPFPFPSGGIGPGSGRGSAGRLHA